MADITIRKKNTRYEIAHNVLSVCVRTRVKNVIETSNKKYQVIKIDRGIAKMPSSPFFVENTRLIYGIEFW